LPKIDHYPQTPLIDATHYGNLALAFLVILLIDTDGVYPGDTDSDSGTKVAKHRPAIIGLQENVPIITKKYGFAERCIVIFASPAV
jgi:hypothetical protein